VTVATPQTNFCRRFAQRLCDCAAPRGFRVWLCDENGSSRDANARMSASGVAAARRAGLQDAVAAAIILENYFAARQPPELVRPAKGKARVPPSERGDTLALRWLGESESALRSVRLKAKSKKASDGTRGPPQPPST